MAVHTDAPGTFGIVYITPTAEGLDTVQAAVIGSIAAHPLSGQAFGSMTEDNGHRDELLKASGVFK
jgi:ammonia channel protein AmtB